MSLHVKKSIGFLLGFLLAFFVGRSFAGTYSITDSFCTLNPVTFNVTASTMADAAAQVYSQLPVCGWYDPVTRVTATSYSITGLDMTVTCDYIDSNGVLSVLTSCKVFTFTFTGVDCSTKTGSVPGVTGGWYSGTAAGGNPGATLCVGGCQYSRGTFGANTTTGEFSARAGQGTGQACTSQPVGTPVDLSTAAPETPSSCLAKNKSFGTVNGQTVCVTAGTTGAAPVKFETAPKTTTTENKDAAGNPVAGGGTTTTEKTASTNGDGTVTIGTKTTNPDGTSTTQTDTQDQSQFCQANPTSPLCEQAKTDCDKNPKALGCMDAGDVADTETLGTKNAATSITPVSVGADNGTCPAPRVIHIPVVGSSVNFSFDKVCEFMSMIRPVVLALAWLGAGLITVGGFRNG